MSISKYDSRLVQRPHDVPPLRRVLWGLVTAVFWAVYLYLWLPLITLLAWVLGLRQGWIHLYRGEHQVDPFLFIALPLICVACAALMIAWGEYNRFRFRRNERRRGAPHVASDADVARGLGASPDVATALAGARVATIVMDAQARLAALAGVAPMAPARDGTPHA